MLSKNARFTFLVYGLFIVVLIASFANSYAEDERVLVEKIELSKNEIRLAVDSDCFISANVSPSTATDKSLIWTIDDENVAKVSSTTAQGAWIRAKGNVGDRTTLTVKSRDDGASVSCLVILSAPVSDIVLWTDSIDATMIVGESMNVYASVLPSDAYDDLKWTSSDDSVASILAYYRGGALIAARSGGVATIKAESTDGSAFSKSIDIFIRVPLESITLPESADVFLNSTLQLKAELTPSNTTDTTLIWRSMNTYVARVNNSGLVTGIGLGTARIVARSPYSKEIIGECMLTVTRPVLAINLTTSYPVIGVGGSTQIIASIAPYNATIKDIGWTVSDKDVARVNDIGLVTGISPGTCVASATALDGSGVAGHIPIEVRGALESISMASTASLYLGQSKTLELTVSPHDMYIDSINWSSSDESVVTVSDKGTITGVSVGEATVKAVAPNGMSASCSVTVSHAVNDIDVFVQDEEIFASSVYNMYTNAEAKFRAVIQPLTLACGINWKSRDRNVARVSYDGAVKAISPGVTRITVSAFDPYTRKTIVSKSFKVKVSVPVTSVSVPNDITIFSGVQKKINAVVKPAGADEKQLTWASSNENVVTVKNGIITAKSVGKAMILATSKNLVTGITQVTVSQPVEEIHLSLPEGIDRVLAGDSFSIEKNVYPKEAKQSVKWTSDNERVATVDSKGRITALKKGSATITASSVDGSGVKGHITVPVEIAATEISFNKAVLELFCGDGNASLSSKTLTPTVRPKSASLNGIHWSSSDPAIASVDKDGKVIAVSEGVCRVTAETDGLFASIIVRVAVLPSYIRFNLDQLTLHVGDKVSVATDVEFDGSDSYLSWKSSKRAVAVVNEKGLIIALNKGKTIISVKTRNGLKASFTLRVKE